MEHMPYASHLTCIFKHFGVNFDGYEVQRVKDNKKIRASTLGSMKLFRTVGKGYVYQPYLQEDDVMVDPREQKFMPHKQDMIFIQKKGIQSLQSFAVQREKEEEDIRGEEDNVESRSENQGEAGPSQVRQSKLDAVLHEFVNFKAETISNFEAIRQQLQTYQSENSAKFDIVIQMLKGIQTEIQSLK